MIDRFNPDERIDIELYRRDGGWRMRVAVGRPGFEHARAMNRQDFEVHDAIAAALCGGAGVGVATAGRPELEATIRRFYEDGNRD